MKPDEKTIAFYDGAAQRYDSQFQSDTPSAYLIAFMALLPAGGAVLDLGCGPARSSVHMRAAGFVPDPVDASQGMVDQANDAHDIGARVLTFDDLDMVADYDGVWANFSLLHAAEADLPRHFAAIAAALKCSGVLHVGMKVGTGTQRDLIERLYTYISVHGLRELLTEAGFDVIAVEEGREVGMAGTNDPFVIMRARKIG